MNAWMHACIWIVLTYLMLNLSLIHDFFKKNIVCVSYCMYDFCLFFKPRKTKEALVGMGKPDDTWREKREREKELRSIDCMSFHRVFLTFVMRSIVM